MGIRRRRVRHDGLSIVSDETRVSGSQTRELAHNQTRRAADSGVQLRDVRYAGLVSADNSQSIDGDLLARGES
jgi:hypothetical protein